MPNAFKDQVVNQYGKRPLVIFHAFCTDGMAAAWAVWHVLGDHADYVPMTYDERHTKFPELDIKDRDLIIVDFSLPPDLLTPERAQEARHILLIDHHKTAYEEWMSVRDEELLRQQNGEERRYSNMWFAYDANHSGALLAWKFSAFYRDLALLWLNTQAAHDAIALEDHHAPMLLRQISDRDLWQFNMDGSREVHAYLRSEGFPNIVDFDKFSGIVWRFDDPVNRAQVYALGGAVLKADLALMRSICDQHTNRIEIEGFNVPICNIPGQLASEAGHYLSENEPFSVTYYDDLATGQRRFSLRSRQGTGVDVAEVAKKLGGGGHRHAAGFTRPLSTSDIFHDNVRSGSE